ncbi:hypothetical protein RJ640_022084 [Escallonia rubra]|uniref:Uncharacterized protein n=1 Tax=Escallonia rubra TaxID=112253 RepID=A0AA88QUL6_9ASTE|nr:hypothetical protein RJ640_022084 [Escallonia rubra]
MDFEKNLSHRVDSAEFVELMMGSGLLNGTPMAVAGGLCPNGMALSCQQLCCCNIAGARDGTNLNEGCWSVGYLPRRRCKSIPLAGGLLPTLRQIAVRSFDDDRAASGLAAGDNF